MRRTILPFLSAVSTVLGGACTDALDKTEARTTEGDAPSEDQAVNEEAGNIGEPTVVDAINLYCEPMEESQSPDLLRSIYTSTCTVKNVPANSPALVWAPALVTLVPPDPAPQPSPEVIDSTSAIYTVSVPFGSVVSVSVAVVVGDLTLTKVLLDLDVVAIAGGYSGPPNQYGIIFERNLSDSTFTAADAASYCAKHGLGWRAPTAIEAGQITPVSKPSEPVYAWSNMSLTIDPSGHVSNVVIPPLADGTMEQYSGRTLEIVNAFSGTVVPSGPPNASVAALRQTMGLPIISAQGFGAFADTLRVAWEAGTGTQVFSVAVATHPLGLTNFPNTQTVFFAKPSELHLVQCVKPAFKKIGVVQADYSCFTGQSTIGVEAKDLEEALDISIFGSSESDGCQDLIAPATFAGNRWTATFQNQPPNTPGGLVMRGTGGGPPIDTGPDPVFQPGARAVAICARSPASSNPAFSLLFLKILQPVGCPSGQIPGLVPDYIWTDPI